MLITGVSKNLETIGLIIVKYLKKRPLSIAYVAGLIYFAYTLSWMFNIRTTELVGNSFFGEFFKYLTLFIMVSVFANGFVVFAWLWKKFKIKLNEPRALLALPAFWAIGEFSKSIFFSIIAFGPGGSIGDYWSFGNLGLVFANTPLRFAGRLVGMYGVSFLIVMSIVALTQVFKGRYKYLTVLLIPVFVSFLGYLLYSQPNGKSLEVGTVSIKDSVEDGHQEGLKKLLDNKKVDTVVLPEYSDFFINSEGKPTDIKLNDSTDLIVDSATNIVKEGDFPYNQINFYKPDGKVINSQPKHFLIPGGEYIPYIYSIILTLTGNASITFDFNQNRSVYRSEAKEQPFTFKGVSYGAIACSGAIAPGVYQNLSSTGADILINSASVSTLGVSPKYYRQADKISSFIATANAKPFAQASRGGNSYIKDINGNIVATTKAKNRPVTFTKSYVQTNTAKTPYSILGEYVIFLSFSYLIWILLYGFRKRWYKSVKK